MSRGRRKIDAKTRWRLGCAGLLLATLPLTQALAEPQQFEIAEGSAAKMLREFGRVAKLQTLFDYELVRNVRTHAVSGKLEADEALSRMLSGTGLTFQRVDERTIAIRPEAMPSSDIGPTIEEVVVASRLLHSAAESAVPVEVYDRPAIQRSGAATITDFLNTLPAVSVQTTQTGQSQGANGSTTVQLRGLPKGTTLLLLNGRRVHGSGASGSGMYFDLSMLPMAAIERIEVLPTGSSAVYGGDAVGGIVNVVLRDGLDGTEFSSRYGQTSDGAYDEQQYSLATGWKSERWSGSVILSYARNSELRGSERKLTSSEDYTPYGGRDVRVTYGNPANVCASDGSLTGLGVRCATVPVGSTGVGLTPADFASTAGQVARTSLNSYYSVMSPAEQMSAFATTTFKLGSNTELFAELLYTNAQRELYVYPPLASITVPANSPNNPFDENVTVSYVFDQLGRICAQCVDTDYYRPLLGARGTFSSDWSWEAAAWSSRDTSEIPTGFVAIDTAGLSAAVANGSFNPFADAPGDVNLLRSFVRTRPRTFKGSADSVNAFVRGPIADWAGGKIEAVFGAEYQRSGLSSDQPGAAATTSYDIDREQSAVFTELRAPLYGGGQRAGADILAMQVAYRYDDYPDFGGRSNFGAGLEFRPMDRLLMRASYSTAFKPPTLYHLHAPTTSFVGAVNDPERGNESVLVAQSYGGNPNLKAETSWSRNFGLVYSLTDNWDATLTQWRMRLEKGFVQVSSSVVLAHPEVYPGRVVRAPVEAGDPYGVGRLISIDQSYGNFGYADESGIDLQLNGKVDTALGTWQPALSVVYVYDYDFEFTPGAGKQSAVSRANDQGSYAPRWKGTLSLGWKGENAQAGVAGRYTGSYRDATTLRANPKTLGDFWYVDLNARLELGKLLMKDSSAWSRLFVAAGARNLLNKEPEYSDSGYGYTGYDPYIYDLMGRYVWIQAGLSL